jgi:hypothetical protein
LGSYNTCNSSTFLASKTSSQQEYRQNNNDPLIAT